MGISVIVLQPEETVDAKWASEEVIYHTGFYERYGWEFYCMAQGDGEPDQTRLYVHY